MIPLTVAQIRALEDAAVAEYGFTALRLMENAGSAAARVLRGTYHLSAMTVSVLCGDGKNGGDGFVVARKLLDECACVYVILTANASRSEEASEMLSRILRTDIHILRLDTQPERVEDALEQSDLVVDAVFGVGFRLPLPDYLRPVFRGLNRSAVPVVALDIPSGLEADTGCFDSDALRADVTVTFIAPKPALTARQTAAVCGQVKTVQIGTDEALLARFTANEIPVTWEQVASCFSPRDFDAHKGNFGRLAVVGGSRGMAGAAGLCLSGALRCGVGLVIGAVPESIYPILSSAIPEAIFWPLPETKAGVLRIPPGDTLAARLADCDAVTMGCGMGCGTPSAALLRELLTSDGPPLVLDADGLKLLAAHIDWLKTVIRPVVLTPHPGEMAALTGLSVAEIQDARTKIAARFAEKWGVTVVLKGHRTAVAHPGLPTAVNTTGNPGMATGGSGDVLAGMIGALLAQGMEAPQAAICAVHLHGLAGDRAAARLSQHSMLPSDLLDELGSLFIRLE